VKESRRKRNEVYGNQARGEPTCHGNWDAEKGQGRRKREREKKKKKKRESPVASKSRLHLVAGGVFFSLPPLLFIFTRRVHNAARAAGPGACLLRRICITKKKLARADDARHVCRLPNRVIYGAPNDRAQLATSEILTPTRITNPDNLQFPARSMRDIT